MHPYLQQVRGPVRRGQAASGRLPVQVPEEQGAPEGVPLLLSEVWGVPEVAEVALLVLPWVRSPFGARSHPGAVFYFTTRGIATTK
jgi:hypothetical protein